eukprot:TRINITY_DN24604_c0_g1_i1.p1 TRINITY_DN24604_c0_g1~~TRINITY_DN24604_c0_g1_i1.p1  ORF type:complete len:390 (+),score=63.06 TRINITY_DN24604_c0_g1_i1:103-1170(+)
MVAVRNGGWEVHVGLGDNGANLRDWHVYDVAANRWTQKADFPASARHHPFYFGVGGTAYAGLGHASGRPVVIERDWYSYSTMRGWATEAAFASYARGGSQLVTTEARVAGTQFSVASGGKVMGFVLSGDGDDHGPMATGEFHAFDPAAAQPWMALPPHPGVSRWAPGSFVMRGTTRVYFTSGQNRRTGALLADLWTIDVGELFTGSGGVATPPGPGILPPPTPDVPPPPTPYVIQPPTPVPGPGVFVNQASSMTPNRGTADDDSGVTSKAWFWPVVIAPVVLLAAVVVAVVLLRKGGEDPPVAVPVSTPAADYQHIPQPGHNRPPAALPPGEEPPHPHPLRQIQTMPPPSRRAHA